MKTMVAICWFKLFNSELSIGQAYLDVIKTPNQTKLDKPELDEDQTILWFTCEDNQVKVHWEISPVCKLRLGTWYKSHPYDLDWTLKAGTADVSEFALKNCKFGKYIGKYMEWMI